MKPFTPWLGVFETLRVDQGNAQFVDEHWIRLREAAAVLGLKVWEDFRKKARGLPKKTGRWRWVLTPEKADAFFQEDKRPVPAAYSLSLAKQVVGSQNWDARFKTLSYLTHWQARHSVKSGEALLCNERGEITTGAMTNVFWVKKGIIFTSSLKTGCRNGVVREWVRLHFPVKEVKVGVEVLDAADEIFLTNSWIGVRTVGRWKGRRMVAGAITEKIRVALKSNIEN